MQFGKQFENTFLVLLNTFILKYFWFFNFKR